MVEPEDDEIGEEVTKVDSVPDVVDVMDSTPVADEVVQVEGNVIAEPVCVQLFFSLFCVVCEELEV